MLMLPLAGNRRTRGTGNITWLTPVRCGSLWQMADSFCSAIPGLTSRSSFVTLRQWKWTLSASDS